ncbi:MAG: hypothetical protein IH596_01755 [Bacteroidales bacterium]|nr:hypothetical protein [Bacteroidales bacterium]
MWRKFGDSLLKVASVFFLGVLIFTGCKSIGPKELTANRIDYSSALGESWKKMMLLNIIKVRYLEPPTFLSVGQMVSNYSFQTSGNIGVSAYGVGNTIMYSDNPTITFIPLTGEKFLKTFLNPIDPARIFAMVQAGYPVDFILQLCLESLNGIHNQSSRDMSQRTADPAFYKILSLLREIQDAGSIGLQVNRTIEGTPTIGFFFSGEMVKPEIQAKIGETRGMLGLIGTRSTFTLVSSPLQGDTGELSVDPRSLIQIMTAVGIGIDLPPSHVNRHLTPPLAVEIAPESLLMHVYSGSACPADAFVAVPYQGEWFWIANDDWKSKRTFTTILFLFTLSDTGTSQEIPTLIFPAR